MSTLNIQIFQHVPFEGPATIEPYFISMGHRVRVTKLFAENSAEVLADTDALIIMGGPMGTSDEESFPWLVDEKRAILKAIELDMPILGICLGAQLLAEALGAKVSSMGYREIGWFPVEANKEFLSHSLGKVFPERFSPLHWHGDTFDIPNSAIALGASSACENQGFVYGSKQIGLQFHLEFDQSSVKRLARNAAAELDGTEFVQSEELMLQKAQLFVEADQLLANFLDEFVGLCE